MNSETNTNYSYLRVMNTKLTDGKHFDVAFRPLTDGKHIAVKHISHNPDGGIRWNKLSCEEARALYDHYCANGAFKVDRPVR